ncbi:hypothetical protein GMA19_02171 [Paenibacillus polymyxa E681]|nr:hypothetical protein GE561_02171 [Paenibacillus polymyxa E681]QNV61844.1 hypothetical protein GMA19_02171 [Paenibacillus polymyxa E681]
MEEAGLAVELKNMPSIRFPKNCGLNSRSDRTYKRRLKRCRSDARERICCIFQNRSSSKRAFQGLKNTHSPFWRAKG